MNTAPLIDEFRTRLAAAMAASGGILAGLPVRLPVDEEHLPENGVIVSVSGYEEIVPGNHTYSLQCSAALRLKPQDHDTAAVTAAGDAFSAACLIALKGMERPAGEEEVYQVLKATATPPFAAADDAVWLYDMGFVLYVQF